MSVEQAKAFIERMKTDEAFREKVMAIEDAEGRIACIHAEGFVCTADEINDVAQEVNTPLAGGGGGSSCVGGATQAEYMCAVSPTADVPEKIRRKNPVTDMKGFSYRIFSSISLWLH